MLSVNFVIWQMSLTLQIKYVGKNCLSHFVKRCVKNEPAKSVTIFSCFLCYSCFCQHFHLKHFQLYYSIYPLLFSFSFLYFFSLTALVGALKALVVLFPYPLEQLYLLMVVMLRALDPLIRRLQLLFLGLDLEYGQSSRLVTLNLPLV